MGTSKHSYNNILNNKIIFEKDTDFQKRIKNLENIEFIKSKLLNVLQDSKIISIKQEKNNDIIIVEKYNKKIALLHRPLKNSGIPGNHNKRWQVYLDCKKEPGMKNYLLGSYLTEDKLIFSIHDDEIFVENYISNENGSYSSSWLFFDLLKETDLNGYSLGSNFIKINSKGEKTGRFRICFEDKYFENSIDLLFSLKHKDKFITEIKGLKENRIKISEYYDLKFIDFDKIKDTYKLRKSIKTKRNSIFIKIALEEAENKCESCEKHFSFLKPNNKMYVEGHHLLPVNFKVQINFKTKLDHPKNIFSLCPTCHRQIHFGKNKDKIKLIENLYLKRKEIYNSIYGISKIEDISKFYNCLILKENELEI